MSSLLSVLFLTLAAASEVLPTCVSFTTFAQCDSLHDCVVCMKNDTFVACEDSVLACPPGSVGVQHELNDTETMFLIGSGLTCVCICFGFILLTFCHTRIARCWAKRKWKPLPLAEEEWVELPRVRGVEQ